MSALSHDLTSRCRQGDRRALAQAITVLESPIANEQTALVDALAPLDFPARVVGFTGPPGVGKSTLITELATFILKQKREPLAILAVDPSSPFTGGALLGDRVRMASLRNEANVFIRSLGSRDASGGLAAAVGGALRLLALAGFETVLLETVGAGQSEIEVAHFASTVCVLHAPGLGDDVQWMKMGLLEAADILIVSKSDRPEAAEVKAQLEQAIAENRDSRGRVLKLLQAAGTALPNAEVWTAPVVLVSALKQENSAGLLSAIVDHEAYLQRAQLQAPLREARIAHELSLQVRLLMQRQMEARLRRSALPRGVVDGTVSFSAAVGELMKGL